MTGIGDGQTNLAEWSFTTMDMFVDNMADATGGAFRSANFGIIGTRGLTAGTGSTAGQLYCSEWNDASDANEKYWVIHMPAKNCQDIQVSFGAYSSNAGPKNFVLEVKYGSEWMQVEEYTLTGSKQSFVFHLPAEANGASELGIRFRAKDDSAINGGIVQSVGTSRMYDIVVSGFLYGLYSFPAIYTVNAVPYTEYPMILTANDIDIVNHKVFCLKYNPNELTLLNFATQMNTSSIDVGAVAGTDLKILSHANGELRFEVNKPYAENAAWSGILTVVTFRANAKGIFNVTLEQ